MSKDNLNLIIILGVLSAIAGFIMLFFCVYFGTATAEAIHHGGGGPGYYNIIVKGYINTYLVGGSILFVMGVPAIVFGYHHFQLKKSRDLNESGGSNVDRST